MATQPHKSQQKRPRGSPTGETPYSASKKRINRAKCSKARRNLTYESVDTGQNPRSRNKVLHDWSTEEVKALVEFILLNSRSIGDCDTWPATKNIEYWDAAAEFVFHRVDNSLKRTGMHDINVCLHIQPQ